MGKTNVRAVVTLRGGFSSKRGTYTNYRIAEKDFEGSVVDALQHVQEVLEEAKDKAVNDEVVTWEKVTLTRTVDRENDDSV